MKPKYLTILIITIVILALLVAGILGFYAFMLKKPTANTQNKQNTSKNTAIIKKSPESTIKLSPGTGAAAAENPVKAGQPKPVPLP